MACVANERLVATAAVTALLAPTVAWFFHEPILYYVTLALSGTAIVAALGAPHQALLQRRLRLGRLAGVRLAATLAIARLGAGVRLTGRKL